MSSHIFSALPPPVPPGKPPDGTEANGLQDENKLSFRDKLLGNKKAAPQRVRTNLIQQGLVMIDHVRGNMLLPQAHIDDTVFKELCEPWMEALVIKLLDKKLGYKMLKNKLALMWKLIGDFDLMDVDNGFYMMKFDMAEDRDKVIGEGPWMIFDHYLAVAKWSPEFVSSTAKIEKTMVWVRFPGMSLIYYDESVLLVLASAIGTPIKVDQRTLSVERGRFARVCVEIDLNQPVVGKICVRGTWYKVAYEG